MTASSPFFMPPVSVGWVPVSAAPAATSPAVLPGVGGANVTAWNGSVVIISPGDTAGAIAKSLGARFAACYRASDQKKRTNFGLTMPGARAGLPVTSRFPSIDGPVGQIEKLLAVDAGNYRVSDALLAGGYSASGAAPAQTGVVGGGIGGAGRVGSGDGGGGAATDEEFWRATADQRCGSLRSIGVTGIPANILVAASSDELGRLARVTGRDVDDLRKMAARIDFNGNGEARLKAIAGLLAEIGAFHHLGRVRKLATAASDELIDKWIEGPVKSDVRLMVGDTTGTYTPESLLRLMNTALKKRDFARAGRMRLVLTEWAKYLQRAGRVDDAAAVIEGLIGHSDRMIRITSIPNAIAHFYAGGDDLRIAQLWFGARYEIGEMLERPSSFGHGEAAVQALVTFSVASTMCGTIGGGEGPLAEASNGLNDIRVGRFPVPPFVQRIALRSAGRDEGEILEWLTRGRVAVRDSFVTAPEDPETAEHLRRFIGMSTTDLVRECDARMDELDAEVGIISDYAADRGTGSELERFMEGLCRRESSIYPRDAALAQTLMARGRHSLASRLENKSRWAFAASKWKGRRCERN